jgi:hypothetical protein
MVWVVFSNPWMLTCLTAPALVAVLCVRTVRRLCLSAGMLLVGGYKYVLICKQAWPGAIFNRPTY